VLEGYAFIADIRHDHRIRNLSCPARSANYMTQGNARLVQFECAAMEEVDLLSLAGTLDFSAQQALLKL